MCRAGNESGGGAFRRSFLQLIGAVAFIGVCMAPAWALPFGYLSDSNGQIAAWGNNSFGECNVPIGTYSAIAGGSYYSVALRADGTVAAWGYSGYGRLNVPAGTYAAVDAGNDHGLALRADGTVVAWGHNDMGQCNVPAGNYSAISGGLNYSVAVRADGTLAAWGWSTYGQCSVPAGTYSAIAAGYYFGLALRPDGTLAAWGTNNFGQLNVPSGTYSGLAAGGYHGLAFAPDGSLVAWGNNNYGQCNVPAGSYSDVAGGYGHSLGLRADGSAVAWGNNDDGQCNVPAGVFVAVAAGGWHSLALFARTTYDGDLLVNGTGVKANLNRSITVAGNASIESTMYCYNSPTMTVAGTTTITPTGAIQGAGTINGRLINEGLVNGALGLILNGLVSGSGNYAGHVTFNGAFRPGTSPASITGDWIIFGQGNVLTMELGGIVQGTEYDHITANQLLTLAGTLDVELINGFNPVPGDRFDLFDGPVAGRFATMNLPELGGGMGWDTGALYTTGVLRVVSPEPATLTLLALGGLGLLARRRKKQAPKQVK